MVDWGVASVPKPGETQSGDGFLVQPAGSGVLAAVVDGLGHGGEAATAAAQALAVLERHPRAPLVELVDRCHQALRGTRGAVMSLAFFDGAANSVTWLGVGNVEVILVPSPGDGGIPGRRSSLVASGGIVGSTLPSLHPQVLPLTAGALVVFASDGIRTGFADALPPGSPQQVADRILDRYNKGTDDSLVLVLRYNK